MTFQVKNKIKNPHTATAAVETEDEEQRITESQLPFRVNTTETQDWLTRNANFQHCDVL